ncbi:MAG: hypothetical protein IJ859_03765 [Synergistaceae bacterium]|nr:hypothetical protein [Synergistaceae bacterium]
MKKILTALIIILTLSSTSLAASEDIYVRQDVFDAKMEVLFTRLDAKIDSLGADMDKKIARLDAKIYAWGAETDKKIARLDAKIDSAVSQLDKKIDTLGADVDKKIMGLDAKIDTSVGELRGDIKALSARVDSLDKRVDHANTFLYYLLVLLGVLLVLPFVNRWLDNKKEREENVRAQNQPFTLDDVRRLIEENNAKLATMFEPKAA